VVVKEPLWRNRKLGMLVVLVVRVALGALVFVVVVVALGPRSIRLCPKHPP